jgi:hypothetical protein
MADNYEQLNRPGREPMLFRSEQRLLSVELSLLLTAGTGKGINSAEFEIDWLRLIARSDKDISLIGLGRLVTGRLFRIVDVSAKSVRMNVKQEITIAEVGISLVQVHYDERQRIPGLIVIKDVPPPEQQGGRTAAAAPNTSVRDPWADRVSRSWPVGTPPPP